MKKICLVSLGCVKNTVDSEAILALFRTADFAIVNKPEDSDVIIVNTCGFIEAAKIEGINVILQMASYKKKLVVIGCLVERYFEELKNDIPEVDLWIKFSDEYKKLTQMIQNLFDNEKVGKEINFYDRVLSTKPYTAYLKISEGCNNFCSFCAIPYIRGRFISYDQTDLINYTKEIVKQGVKEIVVIGQDPTSYGKDLKDKNYNLVTLLKELNDIEGLEFIRCLYLYPDGISDELIDLYASSNKFPHYFDIPIQHASNKILKKMNRKDTYESMHSLFKKIRTKISDAIIRTTVIVGFPGETDKDFESLKEFVKEIKFNHLGCFTYSKEEGTVASKMSHQVSKKVKNQRHDEIMELQSKISYSLNKELVGKEFKAIIIGEDKGDYLVRCTYNSPDDIDGNVYLIKNKIHQEGDIIKIKITHAFVYDLYCQEID